MNNVEIRQKEYILRIAHVISFGLCFSYSSSYIENVICQCGIDDDISSNATSFLNKTVEEIIRESFPFEEKETGLPSNSSFWVAELYLEIIMSTKRTLSYAFAYLPLDEALSMFRIFHQMDISQALNYFKEKEKEKTILRILLKKKKMSMKELSERTGISYPAINKYVKSHDLSSFSFGNIMAISSVFGVDPTIFAKRPSHQ